MALWRFFVFDNENWYLFGPNRQPSLDQLGDVRRCGKKRNSFPLISLNMVFLFERNRDLNSFNNLYILLDQCIKNLSFVHLDMGKVQMKSTLFSLLSLMDDSRFFFFFYLKNAKSLFTRGNDWDIVFQVIY